MSHYLLFDAGGLDLAAPAELIKAIHEDLDVQPVAGTCSWFRGLAVAHGKLLPVTDIGAFAGRRSSTGRTLELEPAAGIAGFQVDNVHGLSDIPISEVPLSEKETNRKEVENLTLTVRAIVQHDRVHRVLDVAAIVQSPAFLSVAE